MENTVRISASVVSHIGMVCEKNNDNFFINGRFMYEHDTNNVQVSIENSAPTYLFAVCDNMERYTEDGSTPISLTKELRKFYERAKTSQKDIYYEFEKLYESIDETSNVIYSMDLIKPGDKVEEGGAAALFISGNKAAVLDTAGCRSYLLRDGKLKSLTVDYKKTERLLKMGIITSEQAKFLASRMGKSANEKEVQCRRTEVFTVKEGDVFLLCTNGLTDNLDEDRIYELLDSVDTDTVSNLLIKEALKAGGEDNVTVLVAKIEKANSPAVGKEEASSHLRGVPINISKAVKSRVSLLQKFLPMATAILIVFGLLFGTYKLWGYLSGLKTSKIDVHNPLDDEGTGTMEPEIEDSDSLEEPDGELKNSEEDNLQIPEYDDSDTQTEWPIEYKVKKGDSLYAISKKFYNDSEKYILIMEANDISNANHIVEGQVLIIPQP